MDEQGQEIRADYQVGYGKPPQASQFKPGQSGNRKGRPKGAQNFSTVIEKELNSVVQVTENGRRRQIRKKDAIAKQLVNKAASGDLKATSLLLGEARAQESATSFSPASASPVVFAPEDQRTVASIVARLRRSMAAEEVRATTASASTEEGAGEPVDGGRDQEQAGGGAA